MNMPVFRSRSDRQRREDAASNGKREAIHMTKRERIAMAYTAALLARDGTAFGETAVGRGIELADQTLIALEHGA